MIVKTQRWREIYGERSGLENKEIRERERENLGFGVMSKV